MEPDWFIENDARISATAKRNNPDQVWTLNKLFSQPSIVELSDNPKRHKKLKKQYESNSRHFRILKSDIRKTYSSMLANIINSGDYSLIRRFFQTFGLPTIEMDIHHDPFGNYDPRYQTNGNFHGKFVGAELIACVLGAFTTSSPDYMVRVQDAQIRIRSDTEGSIVMYNYTVSATYLYDYSIERMVKEALQTVQQAQQAQHTEDQAANNNTNTEVLTTSSSFTSFVEQMQDLSRLRQHFVTPKKMPFLLTVLGNCTMALDEHQRIKFVSFTRSCGTTTYFNHSDLNLCDS